MGIISFIFALAEDMLLAAIPAGPDLTRSAASITRDGTPITVAADAEGVKAAGLAPG